MLFATLCEIVISGEKCFNRERTTNCMRGSRKSAWGVCVFVGGPTTLFSNLFYIGEMRSNLLLASSIHLRQPCVQL